MKRALVKFVVSISMVGLSITLSTSAHAFDFCGAHGTGSKSDPMVLTETPDMKPLDCLDPSYSLIAPDNNQNLYVEAGTNLTKSTNLYFPVATYEHLHFDGKGHTITFNNVSGANGVFGTTSNADIKNIVINSNDSFLANGAGWISIEDEGSKFTNIAIDAPISLYSGGIVGAGRNSVITSSHSTGLIDHYAGGLAGSASTGVTISKSYSLGTILQYAGGLVGVNSDHITISNSYTTGLIESNGGGFIAPSSSNAVITNSYTVGNIGINSGGIIGPLATQPVVTNSYTLGTIDDNAGGIFGPVNTMYFGANLYTAGIKLFSNGGIVAGESIDNPTHDTSSVTNSYSEGNNGGGSYSFTNINRTLTGIGSFGKLPWGNCPLVSEFIYIQALYTSDPCKATFKANSALAKAKKLTLKKSNTLLKSVTTDGTITTAQVWCEVKRKKVSTKKLKNVCLIKVRKGTTQIVGSPTGTYKATLSVKPLCSKNLVVKAKVVVTAPQKNPATWTRSWTVKDSKKTKCKI